MKLADLKSTDCVIVGRDGQMVKLNSGRIVIYKNMAEAIEDLETGETVAMVDTLSEQQRTTLIENIVAFEE